MSSADPATPASFFTSEVNPNALEQSFPEVPSNVWAKVMDAEGFTSGFNQENLFRQQYFEAAKQYYEAATAVNAQGRAILKLFLRWMDVSMRFTEFVLSGDADNPLDANLDYDPEGNGEAFLRPLRTDSFADGNGNSITSYTQLPQTAGQFNLLPDEANSATTLTATGNEQAWMILGWIDPLAGDEVPYDYVQADVSDNVGVRREEFLMYQMEGKRTLNVAERSRGPLLVEPGFDLDVDVNVKTTDITLSLWPIGFEVIRADAPEFGGVLG